MAKKTDRNLITLACEACKLRNYHSQKNKRNDPDRLTLRKYCLTCRSHQSHRESR